jgi:serine/threonine protein kinase
MSSDPKQDREDPDRRNPESANTDPDEITAAREEMLKRISELSGEVSGRGPVPSSVLMVTSGDDRSVPIDTWVSTPPGAKATSFDRGMVLLDKYLVLEKLGEGGIGSVWLVQELGSGAKRALKVMHPSIAEAVTDRSRLDSKALASAHSRHPGAVVVHESGTMGDVPYILMEYLEGRTLRKILDSGRPCALPWVVWFLREICEILGHAHEVGVVHLDLKPENIMIIRKPDTGEEHVKLLDFGTPMMIPGAGAIFVGTAPYMAPEQIRGETHRLDGRTDVYALGVVLYEMLTGSRPFTGRAIGLFYHQLHTSPPLFASKALEIRVPPAIEAVVRRCLEKSMADRPSTVREVYEAFRKAAEGYTPSGREEPVAAAETALSPQGATGTRGFLRNLLGWLRGSPRKRVEGRASSARQELESARRPGMEPVRSENPGAPILRRADVSFPTRVLVGKPYDLSIQLVPVEGDGPGGVPSARAVLHAGGSPLSFLAFSFASPAGTGVPASIEVIVSLAAENLEISGHRRAELSAPLQGFSDTVQFSLRGVEVGPARVMIDFAQGGRPIGSVDLAPEVVAATDAKRPSETPSLPAASLTLNLATGSIPSPPDLVIKVFDHRLAGHAGRLQFVLSSIRRDLSDLPVLDGDLGTLDLRADVVDWVGDQLREVGAVAERPDVTAQEAERVLARIGCNLYQQLLPPSLQTLCWTLRERGVRVVMVLSDEPHIPWECIKPYRDNPRTGEYEEDEFWGHSYALTHWLRGRPPVAKLSFNRICALAANVDSPQAGQAPWPRDMVSVVSGPPSDAELPPQGPATRLMAIDEELNVLRSLEASGCRFRFLPARRREILGLLEEGEFDLLHLITHGDFAGVSSADASAVRVEDGAFAVAELSPRMAAALRRAAPLIFFNSCHTGRIGFSLTRLGSWGAQFVHSGCGGFVGTLWPVTDKAALAFAQAFYGRMCQGLPIGQAMMAARQQVRERYPNDPTWLAYCCFADPMAQVEPLHASV